LRNREGAFARYRDEEVELVPSGVIAHETHLFG
jgi:hypothetical protein